MLTIRLIHYVLIDVFSAAHMRMTGKRRLLPISEMLYKNFM